MKAFWFFGENEFVDPCQFPLIDETPSSETVYPTSKGEGRIWAIMAAVIENCPVRANGMPNLQAGIPVNLILQTAKRIYDAHMFRAEMDPSDEETFYLGDPLETSINLLRQTLSKMADGSVGLLITSSVADSMP